MEKKIRSMFKLMKEKQFKKNQGWSKVDIPNRKHRKLYKTISQ